MKEQFGCSKKLLESEEEFLGHDLASGISPSKKALLCQGWAQGSILVYSAKYKSVEKKFHPVNVAMLQHLNPPVQQPTMSKQLYATPLSPHPPDFVFLQAR
jgi:hypothetical protein